MDKVVRIHGDCFRNRDEQASELPQLVNEKQFFIRGLRLSGHFLYILV